MYEDEEELEDEEEAVDEEDEEMDETMDDVNGDGGSETVPFPPLEPSLKSVVGVSGRTQGLFDSCCVVTLWLIVVQTPPSCLQPQARKKYYNRFAELPTV